MTPLPCPLCHGEAGIIEHSDHSFDVHCTTHGCYLEFGAEWHLPLCDVVHLWNNRTEATLDTSLEDQ